MRAGAAAVLYVAVMLGVVVLFNAGISEAQLIWLAASFCLGWITRYPWLAFLPLLASPIAVPFGYADGGTGGDPLLLWSEVLLAAPIQGAIVITGFGGRLLYERFRASRTQLAEVTPVRGDDEKHAGDCERDSRDDRSCSAQPELRDLCRGQPDASEEHE